MAKYVNTKVVEIYIPTNDCPTDKIRPFDKHLFIWEGVVLSYMDHLNVYNVYDDYKIKIGVGVRP